MIVRKIHIKGFRNFDDEEITFQKKTLIIGANDVGKSNLLYALRLLFDKTISEHDLELKDSDYNAYSKADSIEITVTIEEVHEECLLSAFNGSVKDGTTVIRYTNSKGGQYSILNGYDEKVLMEQPGRTYIKRLNMQCVDTNRDLFGFLKKERNQMLQLAKEKLVPEKKAKDEGKTKDIQDKLDKINAEVSDLNYVSSALDSVNKELSELSIHNEDQNVQFVAGESDAEKLLENLVLTSSSGENFLAIGGDGRNNQIFLATWIAKQNIKRNIDSVTFYAIEEPEAHLHPHQQRKLSEYIQSKFEDQIWITSHSPHIASKFEAGSIVRLFSINKYTHAACSGCSQLLKSELERFGYRLNALSAETFFSSGVFLVEGVSEVLFYTALSKEIGIDLDKLNISILSVEGVGFKPYVAVCNALQIPWVLRTDNDIFSKPKKKPTENYYAGVSRIMGILKQLVEPKNLLLQYWNEHQVENEWAYKHSVPQKATVLNNNIKSKAEEYGLFLSDVDLETDLARSSLFSILKSHYNKRVETTLIKAMQTHKAINMMNFLNTNHNKLNLLAQDDISKPLNSLKKAVEERIHPNHDKEANKRTEKGD